MGSGQRVKVSRTFKVQSLLRAAAAAAVDSRDKAAVWPEPVELIFILACLRREVMMPTAAKD